MQSALSDVVCNHVDRNDAKNRIAIFIWRRLIFWILSCVKCRMREYQIDNFESLCACLIIHLKKQLNIVSDKIVIYHAIKDLTLFAIENCHVINFFQRNRRDCLLDFNFLRFDVIHKCIYIHWISFQLQLIKFLVYVALIKIKIAWHF